MTVAKWVLLLYTMGLFAKMYLDVKTHMDQRLKTFVASTISSEFQRIVHQVTDMLVAYADLKRGRRLKHRAYRG